MVAQSSYWVESCNERYRDALPSEYRNKWFVVRHVASVLADTHSGIPVRQDELCDEARHYALDSDATFAVFPDRESAEHAAALMCLLEAAKP